ncbi:MAG TPA: hypothetical protein VIE88_06875 [Vicinamibacteria bacterium]|jgi:hypothetical protein
MKARILSIAIALAACQPEPPTGDSAPKEEANPLVDRAWTQSDSGELPGVLRVFLSDGTLLMDSCWETYRLARWRMESDRNLIWQEDASEIRAEIVSLSPDELVLRFQMKGESREERFRAARVPYLCPDMPR